MSDAKKIAELMKRLEGPLGPFAVETQKEARETIARLLVERDDARAALAKIREALRQIHARTYSSDRGQRLGDTSVAEIADIAAAAGGRS